MVGLTCGINAGSTFCGAQAKNASEWSLPSGFLPSGRPPLTYHGSLDRWTLKGQRAHLSVVAKGQEFVLDLAVYPELTAWLAETIAGE